MLKVESQATEYLSSNKRERARHYIPASDADIDAMLQTVGVASLEDLYAHLPESIRMEQPLDLPKELEYEALKERMAQIAAQNNPKLSFIGDGLPHFSQHPIVEYVSGLRGLTTAYTPYQPEMSQGTLYAHWIYQCLLAQLTGFEAINSSLYDRSTAIFEAICTAVRLNRKADTVIIPEALYPGDLEVVRTLAEDSGVELIALPLDAETGCIDLPALRTKADATGTALAAIVFPQVNTLGLLEDVDALTDFCAEIGTKSIAVIDPLLLATGGLKPPVDFGEKGADFIVGEAQHLAIGPNCGGPGLGLFGVRYNDTQKNAVRQTPGRYVGKAHDVEGQECRVMVLSTREQHIRKDKATSNICSNQAFLATLVGASLLARGEGGLQQMVAQARETALEASKALLRLPGVVRAFPQAHFYNEITLKLDRPVGDVLRELRMMGIHGGVDVSDRIAGNAQLLKLSFSDLHSSDDLHELLEAMSTVFGPRGKQKAQIGQIPAKFLRQEAAGLPEIGEDEIREWYRKLNGLNMSPDDAPYPLGSCTMKYNPYVNDWAATLSGFTQAHPQAPESDLQGCLEALYEIQEWFKKITGLAGVTTQPVAGAQGELAGIKMIQAYHRDHGQGSRDVVFIPKSAHGTNFATAVMAGYRGRDGIVLLKADARGCIDREDFEAKLAQYGERLAAVMITNPNTSGFFESDFAQIAEKVHQAGGLVYMDGANMNAICGWVDLDKLGVDAVHQNLHKTWTIPHGGGGPGDAVVAVSERLVDYLPGRQVAQENGRYVSYRTEKSIGSFHRHWGNFAHKVRALCYLYRLGYEGIPRLSAMAVLSARYLYTGLRETYQTLPAENALPPHMHEFILSLKVDEFAQLEAAGLQKSEILPQLGKLFLDNGYHAPTMGWPEPYGMMIEPTESYTKDELDRFLLTVRAIHRITMESPTQLKQAPSQTPVRRIDEVGANRNLCLSEKLETLPTLPSCPERHL